MELKTLTYCFVIIFCSNFLFVSSFEKARYDNYRVYNIFIGNQEQLDLVRNFDSYPDGYDLLRYPHGVNTNVELVVPPHKLGEFSELMERFQLTAELMVPNLQEIFDNEQPNVRSPGRLDWTRYWRLSEVYSWLKQLVREYQNDIELISVGRSFEGREILGVKYNVGKISGKKQIIFEGTMHAREWISTATVTWMLNELLTSRSPDIRQLAETYEWIILPVINVDGYEFSWTRNRLWRKTRQPSGRFCTGIDPNRNFDNFFNQDGSSSNPCSNFYAGSFPFSEPETRQYSEFMANLPNLAGYFSFHSFGQMLLLPYGFTHELLDNYDELYEIGLKAVDALRARFGTVYRLGSIANVLYVATGNSLDWLKYNFHTNVTYVYELRDRGPFMFFLPASQIIDNSLETFDSIVTILQEAQRKGIA